MLLLPGTLRDNEDFSNVYLGGLITLRVVSASEAAFGWSFSLSLCVRLKGSTFVFTMSRGCFLLPPVFLSQHFGDKMVGLFILHLV